MDTAVRRAIKMIESVPQWTPTHYLKTVFGHVEQHARMVQLAQKAISNSVISEDLIPVPPERTRRIDNLRLPPYTYHMF